MISCVISSRQTLVRFGAVPLNSLLLMTQPKQSNPNDNNTARKIQPGESATSSLNFLDCITGSKDDAASQSQTKLAALAKLIQIQVLPHCELLTPQGSSLQEIHDLKKVVPSPIAQVASVSYTHLTLPTNREV